MEYSEELRKYRRSARMLGLGRNELNKCTLIRENPFVHLMSAAGVLGARGKGKLEEHLGACGPCRSSYYDLGGLIEGAVQQRVGYMMLAGAVIPAVERHPEVFEEVRDLERFVESSLAKMVNRELRERSVECQSSDPLYASALAGVSWIASERYDERRFGYWLLHCDYIKSTDGATGRGVAYNGEAEMPVIDHSLVTVTPKGREVAKITNGVGNPILKFMDRALSAYLSCP